MSFMSQLISVLEMRLTTEMHCVLWLLLHLDIALVNVTQRSIDNQDLLFSLGGGVYLPVGSRTVAPYPGGKWGQMPPEQEKFTFFCINLPFFMLIFAFFLKICPFFGENSALFPVCPLCFFNSSAPLFQ